MLELMCESPSLWTHMADVYSSPCDQLSELLSMFAVLFKYDALCPLGKMPSLLLWEDGLFF